MISKAIKTLMAIFFLLIAVGYLNEQTKIDKDSRVIRIKDKYTQYKNKAIFNRWNIKIAKRFIETDKGKTYEIQGSPLRFDFFPEERYKLFRKDHCYIVETEGNITDIHPYKNIVNAGEYSCL